jgi:uncharacterized membrane protein
VSWIVFALLSALGNAATSLLFKRAIANSDALVSTAAFRVLSGLMLVAFVTVVGAWHYPTLGYWWLVTAVLPFEVGGLVCMSLALRSGDLSQVAPISGLLPVFVSIFGAVFLHEMPTALSAVGTVLVAAGVYCVGLQRSKSAFEPLLALGRLPSARYAVVSAILWSLATIVHKYGVAEVGPLMWATTVALGSGLVIAAALPFTRRMVPATAPTAGSSGGIAASSHVRLWTGLVIFAAFSFAVQQAALQLALQKAQAGYVIALSSTQTLLATALGLLLLGEPGGQARILGALLVTCGAALVALGG